MKFDAAMGIFFLNFFLPNSFIVPDCNINTFCLYKLNTCILHIILLINFLQDKDIHVHVTNSI